MQAGQFDAIHVIELLVTALITVYFAMSRRRDQQVDVALKKLEDQDDACEKRIGNLTDRLVTEEKATVHQYGEINLVKQRQEMVTKAELTSVEKRVEQCVELMRPRGYGSGGMPAQTQYNYGPKPGDSNDPRR